MSHAEKQALALRDLAVIVAKAKGSTTTQITAPDQSGQYVFEDARLRIEYCSGKPQALDVFRRGDLDLKVLSVIWNDGGDGDGSVVVLHRTGSWEDSLKRLAKAVRSSGTAVTLHLLS
jgi:hypothetical protein